MGAAAAAIAGAAIAAGTGLLGTAINHGEYNTTMAYNKELQEKIFEREDTAVQRRAKDLEAAGLSKTLAAGSAAGTGQAIELTPYHSDIGKVGQDTVNASINALNSYYDIKKSEAQLKQMNEVKKGQELANAEQGIKNDILQHDWNIIKQGKFLSNSSSLVRDLQGLFQQLSGGNQPIPSAGSALDFLKGLVPPPGGIGKGAEGPDGKSITNPFEAWQKKAQAAYEKRSAELKHKSFQKELDRQSKAEARAKEYARSQISGPYSKGY